MLGRGKQREIEELKLKIKHLEEEQVTVQTLMEKTEEEKNNLKEKLNLEEKNKEGIVEQLDGLSLQFQMITKALGLSQVATEGIWGMRVNVEDKGRRDTWYSPQVRKLLGFTDIKDFPHRIESLYNQIPVNLKEGFIQEFEFYIKRWKIGEVFKREIKLQNKNGEHRIFYIFAESFMDEKGDYLTLSGILTDMTEGLNRKQKEEEFKENMNVFNNGIKDMVGSIKYISKEAKDVLSVYSDTSENVEKTKGSINQMKTITDSIKSISEQINLLGLNANIEAARAGEAGKGFAVVANEVQNLAINSSEAAGDIEEIINKVNDSVTLIVKSIETLQKQAESQMLSTEKVSESAESIQSNSAILLEHLKSFN